MDFGAVEVEISEFLNTKVEIDSLFVEPLPENDGEFERPFAKQKIYVAFSNELPGENSKSVFIVAQECEVTFSFLLQSKTLRGNTGIYKMAAFVKKHMVGYKPSNGELFKYSGLRMENRERNVFEYTMDFKTKSQSIQATDNDEETGALLKKVEYV